MKVPLEPLSLLHLWRPRCFLWLKSLRIFLHFSTYTDQTIFCEFIFLQNEHIVPSLLLVFPTTGPYFVSASMCGVLTVWWALGGSSDQNDNSCPWGSWHLFGGRGGKRKAALALTSGSGGWTIVPHTKRLGLDSQSGHVRRLQVRSPVGACNGRQPIDVSVSY